MTVPRDASVALALSASVSSDEVALETSKIATMLKQHSDIKRYVVRVCFLTHVAVINTSLPML